MSFFIFKLCNYLLMENQKYISELQNILNKKMDGGFGKNMDANYEYSQSNLLNAIRKPQNAKN